MASPTPTRDGWRTITRTPSLILCEIAWRWTFGIAMWVVLVYIVLSSLGHVRITDAELRVIRAFDPYSTAYVLLRVANAILPVVLRVCGYTLAPLVVLWVAAATIGRAATLKALLGERVGQIRWQSLAGVNLLRVVVLFAAVLAFVGSTILVGRLFAGEPNLIGVAVLLSLGINLLIGCVWSMLNWFLSLAPIFVVRDGMGSLGAFAASLDLFRERSGPYMGVAVGLGLVRLVLISLVSFASLIPLAMIGEYRVGGILLISAFVCAVYWALTDVVQIWRIAAYVALALYEPETPVLAAVLPEPTAPGAEIPAADLPGTSQPEPSI